LSERLGPLAYSEEEGEVFLGRSVTKHKMVSEETAHLIDEEIRSFIDRNYERSECILKENLDKLHVMADALMKYETIDHLQIDDIMAGKEPRPPQNWEESPPSDGASTRSISTESDTSEEAGKTAEQH
jgi:cell division protease FtsH